MEKRKYTLTEIIGSLPDSKNKQDPYIVQYFIRPISFLITWIFLRINITANQVSYISALVCVISAIALAFGSETIQFWGVIGLNIFSILDAVDGNIARVKVTENKYGGWADALSGYIAYSVSLPAAGIASAKLFSPQSFQYFWILFFGYGSAIATLLTRVVYQKYQNVHHKNEAKIYNSTLAKISREIGLTGLLLPMILLGFMLKKLYIVVVFYGVFYTISSALVIFKFVIEVERYTQLK